MNIKVFFVFLFSVFIFDNIALSKQKPKIIGVVGTIEDNEGGKLKEQITALPFYWIRQNYLNNISNACAGQNVAFVMLPLDVAQVKQLSKTIDGLILTGGDESFSSKRGLFEQELLKEVIKQKKQILGICRGHQLINYYFAKDNLKNKDGLKSENLLSVKDSFPNNTKHNDSSILKAQYNTMHKVKLDKRSRLAKILNKTEIDVNSKHNHAIDKIGDGVLVYGISPKDGVPEMIEIKGYPKFLVGVQWHPEFLSTDDDVKLLQAFCKAVVNNE